MFRHTDGVVMRSPLRSVLANVFMEYCESRIPVEHYSILCIALIWMTHALCSLMRMRPLCSRLDDVNRSLKFTMEKAVAMEKAVDGVLPFLGDKTGKWFRQNSLSQANVYRTPYKVG